MLEEDRKVIGDLVISDQVFGIVTSVQFLAEVLAHLVYFGDRIREADVRVFRVVEANGSKHLQLFFHLDGISCLLFFVQLDVFCVFLVGDSGQRPHLPLKSTQVVRIVLDAPVELYQHHANLHAQAGLLFLEVSGVVVLLEGLLAQVV